MSKKTIHTILTEAANTVSLSVSEKETMRERMAEYIAYNPIRPPRAAPQKSFGSFFDTFTFRYVPAFIIAGLVFSGAGVSYAAEGALPGDLLYPVKLNINEEIVSVLTADPIDRAVWEATRAERRLFEVSALAKEGLLTNEAIAIATDSFAEQAERAVKNVAELSKNDPASAAEVTAELESAFETHEMILASLSADASDSDVKSIAAQARKEAKRVAMIRAEVESSIVPEDTAAMAKGMDTMAMSAPSTSDEEQSEKADAKTQKAAAKMKEAAHRALVKFTEQAQVHQGEAEVAGLLAELDAELLLGTDRFTAGAYAEAYRHFRTVVSKSTRGARVLEAEERLQIALPIGEEWEEAGEAPEVPDDTPSVNPEAPSIEGATNAKSSAQAVFTALDNVAVAELSTSDMAQFKRSIKEARAYMVRGDLAVGGGDGYEALRLYERAIEKATAILKNVEGTSTSSPVVVDDPEAVLVANTVHHSQLNGVHVYEGLVRTPTPCYEVTADTVTPRSGQITLVVKWKEIGGMCAQSAAEKQFSASRSARESDMLTTVYVGGKKIEAFKVLEISNEPVITASGTATTAMEGFIAPADELLKRVNGMLENVTGS